MVKESSYHLMDELYFVTHFNELLEATNLEPALLKNALQELLAANWVDQLQFDGNEYQKMNKPNYSRLEKDAFLATKEGLLAHNGFGK